MLNHYETIKKYFDRGLRDYMKYYDLNPDSKIFGNIPNYYNDIYDSMFMLLSAARPLIGYYLPNSPCHGDASLLLSARRIIEANEKMIHDDGSIDMIITNFHDASACAFDITYGFGDALLVAIKYNTHTPEEEELIAISKRVLLKMCKALGTLGFHTPNHRWVQSAALSYIWRITGSPEAREKLDKYLAEGIDCDENGEFTERSPGSYNNVCDRSLMMIAQNTERKDLYEHVKRNLRLMSSMIEPDETLCTQNSIRQDYGSSFDFTQYYQVYLFMALQFHDSEFAYYADRCLEKIMAEALKQGDNYNPLCNDELCYYMLFEDFIEREKTIIPQKPTRDLSVYLPKSGMARVYGKNSTLTVLKTEHSDFIKFQYGSKAALIRFAGAFFGVPHSYFKAASMEKTEKGFRLKSNEKCGYRSVLETPQATPFWTEMDHSARREVNVQSFETEIDITVLEDGFALDISTSGCEGILTKLEILLMPGGTFQNDSMLVNTVAGDYIILKEGEADYYLGMQEMLHIKGGSYAHNFGKDMRGTTPPPSNMFAIVTTSSVPNKQHVEITAKTVLYNDVIK